MCAWYVRSFVRSFICSFVFFPFHPLSFVYVKVVLEFVICKDPLTDFIYIGTVGRYASEGLNSTIPTQSRYRDAKVTD